jgi:hypothetical protein
MKFRCENNYFQDLAYEQIKEGWKFYALLGRKLCSFMQRVAFLYHLLSLPFLSMLRLIFIIY